MPNTNLLAGRPLLRPDILLIVLALDAEDYCEIHAVRREYQCRYLWCKRTIAIGERHYRNGSKRGCAQCIETIRAMWTAHKEANGYV